MKIGFPHKPRPIGGTGSFQERLTFQLQNLGWQVVYPEDRIAPDIVLVVAGTRKLRWLRHCRQQGIRIVHRLGGMNWLYRTGCRTEGRHVLPMLRNYLFSTIRARYADTVVYQSEFARNWWNRACGVWRGHQVIIGNGVDLQAFKPGRQESRKRLISVEGIVEYSPVNTGIIDVLAREVEFGSLADIFEVYGKVSDKLRRRYAGYRKVRIMGPVPRDQIHTVYPGSVFVSLDVNAACPNSVIEALASGCPVVAFATGALPELVSPECGILVPYGADVWRLETPAYGTLVDAVRQAFERRAELAPAARRAAEAKFSLTDVLHAYLQVLSGKA
jgi:glycosyltransferase involved in cell wall biosynthesis